jgi:D-alanine-D-alanine ligase
MGEFRDSSESSALPDVERISASLSEAGHEVRCVAADDVASLYACAEGYQPDLVFNVCDSFAGRAALEMNVPAFFELFDVPCTGSSPLTLGVAQNKALAKAVLRSHGIPTPMDVVVAPGEGLAEAAKLLFPLIVKPVAEDASLGIDDGAVVHDAAALAARIRFVWREFGQAALVEAFIEGREFHVSLIAKSPSEFIVLPISEVDFGALKPGRPRILGYESKWGDGLDRDRAPAICGPAQLDARSAATIARHVIAAARAVNLCDYGRVDLRVSAHESAPFVLEVNPNPDLNPDCAFASAALASGRSYGDTIREIAARAMERAGGMPAGWGP